MENQYKYLFLASGVKNGQGFWLVGTKNCDENILDNKYLLDCYRKELIGNESSKDIISAIDLNLNTLLNELKINNYLIDQPSLGISFNIPLDTLINIFDFWLDVYKDKEAWEICLGLLKTRKRVSLLALIKSGSLKGNSKKWAIKIEKLHSYTPTSIKNNFSNSPMWN